MPYQLHCCPLGVATLLLDELTTEEELLTTELTTEEELLTTLEIDELATELEELDGVVPEQIEPVKAGTSPDPPFLST